MDNFRPPKSINMLVNLRRDNHGQQAIEYLIMFALIIAVVVGLLTPSGRFSQLIDDSLETSTTGIEAITANICFDDVGEPC